MTVEEAKKAIEEFRAQGDTDEDIVGIFYMMFCDDKLSLEEFEDLLDLMDYELTEEFKAMTEEEKKTKGWEEIEDEETGEGIENPQPEAKAEEEPAKKESESDEDKARKLFGY